MELGRQSGVGARFGAGLAAAMLTGCGITDISLTGPLEGPSAGQAVSNLWQYGSLESPDSPRGDKKDNRSGALFCPDINVRDGTDSVRIYAGGQSGTNVRYEYALGDVARKCARAGGEITLKVGVEGRVLLGPAGSPGSFNVPVRIVVIRNATQEPALSKLYTVPVTVTAGNAPFRFVADNLAVPFLSNKGAVDYRIEVGFDAVAGGAKTDRPPGKRRRRGPASAAPADAG